MGIYECGQHLGEPFRKLVYSDSALRSLSGVATTLCGIQQDLLVCVDKQLSLRGKGIFAPAKTDGTPVQVLCTP